MIARWPFISRSLTGWCEMNETKKENKECGHWIEIIIERHWSSLCPWYNSVIFLICLGGSWGMCTPWVHGSAAGGCCADHYWRFWALASRWVHSKLDSSHAAPSGKGRQTCTPWVGSIAQPVHCCHWHSWAAKRECVPKHSPHLNRNTLMVVCFPLNYEFFEWLANTLPLKRMVSSKVNSSLS